MSQLLDRKGAQNVTLIDVRGLSSITDFLVIGTGTSSRQMETLVDAPCTEMKRLGFPASHVEGNGTHWVIADFSDVLLHVFDDATRRHFDIEGLWEKAPRISWQTNQGQTVSGS
jgi:ribosome-associated protein